MKHLLFCCLPLAAGIACAAAARAPLMVNEDAWYFIGHRPAEEMTVEGLKAHIDRYDADGYELDTLRFWEHLTSGREREEAHFLTEFILRCRAYTRELAVKRGHAIRLSARTLTSYEASRAFGSPRRSTA